MNLHTLTSFAAGHYVHWGVISVSVTNLIIILATIVIFVLALVLPFPLRHDATDATDATDAHDATDAAGDRR